MWFVANSSLLPAIFGGDFIVPVILRPPPPYPDGGSARHDRRREASAAGAITTVSDRNRVVHMGFGTSAARYSAGLLEAATGGSVPCSEHTCTRSFGTGIDCEVIHIAGSVVLYTSRCMESFAERPCCYKWVLAPYQRGQYTLLGEGRHVLSVYRLGGAGMLKA